MIQTILYIIAIFMFLIFIITQLIMCVNDNKRNKKWIEEIDQHIKESKMRMELAKQEIEKNKSVQKKKRTKKDEAK